MIEKLDPDSDYTEMVYILKINELVDFVNNHESMHMIDDQNIAEMEQKVNALTNERQNPQPTPDVPPVDTPWHFVRKIYAISQTRQEKESVVFKL